MFLHVGNNKLIRIKDIVGIFDTDNTTISSVSRKYLINAEQNNMVESANEEIPKSFLLYKDKENNYKICFSQISTTALKLRIMETIK